MSERDSLAASPLTGHAEAFLLFRRAHESGRLHHGWMIHGEPGIGKTSFAFACARLLLGGTDPQSRAGRQITAGTHPNLLLITRRMDEKRKRMRQEIVIDDVRPVQDFLHHTAADGAWRVVIVDAAEALNRNAANALLKLLEEPPTDTVFFLTCPAPSALLPTIRSRCRLLGLDPLSDEETRQVLTRHGRAADSLPALVAQAQGAPGRVLASDQSTDDAARQLAQALMEGRMAIDPETLAGLLRHDDGFAVLCSLLGEGLANRARQLAGQGKLTEASKAAEAFAFLQALQRETERFNLDKNQAVRQAAAIASAP
ncbi:DNA polymerase III subunit delta' [Asaia sp. W19]|uniref:AAA family ATPase n=1 Tax=unclassified Asaia TaxID=2685023 RepID=UPI000F8E4E49|nr:AAA family ATPase [Asaia sp. W19]RUT25797.1 DNA polymerase III subunit delta' [Asaia sp. W19]